MTTPTPSSLRRAEEIINEYIAVVGKQCSHYREMEWVKIIATSIDQAIREERERTIWQIEELRRKLRCIKAQHYEPDKLVRKLSDWEKRLERQGMKIAALTIERDTARSEERRRTVEECAKVAESTKMNWVSPPGQPTGDGMGVQRSVAEAIRSLSRPEKAEKPDAKT